MFYASYVRISIFIPIFATLPMYLAKKLSFGDIMQTRATFARVQDGFGWFLDVYKQLIVWAAVVERLARFQEALEQQPALAPRQRRRRTTNRSAKPCHRRRQGVAHRP